MRKFTILILDDIEENIYSLKLMIEDSFDLNILTALNAQDAISLLMTNEIDLILSDIHMPDIDGFEFVDYIKSIEKMKDIPIIFITGIYDKDFYKKKAYDLGIIEYISKPIEYGLLTSKLKVYIEIFDTKKHSEEELEQVNKLLVYNTKMASMGEMIGVISHQLKQPLNILSLYCHDIKFSYDMNELDKKAINDFDVNTKMQIQHMSNTIDSFLSFFTLEKKFSEISIKESVDVFLDLMKSEISKNNIILEIDLEDNNIFGVKMELSQVFMNLVTNSIQAYNEREIKDREIKIKSFKKDKNIIIEISDNAGGINEDNLEKLFDPYFTTKTTGTGIGLYMVKIVVINSFKGNIEVRNSSKGIKFIMSFPKVGNLKK